MGIPVLFLSIIKLIRKQQRQDESHHHADDDLQRQTHLHIVHKRVTTRLHHQCIRRRGEWRGEAHAGSQGDRKEEGIRTHTHLLGCH